MDSGESQATLAGWTLVDSKHCGNVDFGEMDSSKNAKDEKGCQKSRVLSQYNTIDGSPYDLNQPMLVTPDQDQIVNEYRKRLANVRWQALQAHTSDINCVEFAGNQILVSSSNDHTV